MHLSKRLLTIAAMVTEGNRLADVGTDHGFVPIYLLQQNRIPGAIAMDINEGPLMRANTHIKEAGLEDKIITRLSDGLDQLEPGEADTILIAGMGGPLLIDILKRGNKTAMQASELILSPHSDWKLVRKYLAEAGFRIEKEEMVSEDGKYYVILRVTYGKMEPWTEPEYVYGKCLIDAGHPVLAAYLEKETATYKKILAHINNSEAKDSKEIQQEILYKLHRIETVQRQMKQKQSR